MSKHTTNQHAICLILIVLTNPDPELNPETESQNFKV